MEAHSSEGGLASFYIPQPPHLHHQHQNPNPSDGFNNIHHNNDINDGNNSNAAAVFPHSVASAVANSSLESVKRKRGRPRKYGTPEQAAAAKRRSAAAASSFSSSSSKSQITTGALGNGGQSFSPCIIHVAAGEDVGQKIMTFTQQSKREICIISGSGSISNASLRQPATSGGGITYEGRFNILSISGSYILTEHGGRTGGLNVCLSSSDGQVIGGAVGGPLIAAGPIQVIGGTFLVDVKKDPRRDVAPPANLNFCDSPHQSGVGSQFLFQQQNLQFNSPHSSMEWR